MATGTTTTSQITAINSYYDRTVLDNAIPYLSHEKFAQFKPLPKGNSTTQTFRKYNALSIVTTPLDESTNPDPEQLSKTDITATVQIFGNYVKITELVNWTSENPILTEAAELLGEQAGESLDTICRNILVAGTTVQYANNVSSRSEIVTAPSLLDLKKIERTLLSNKAKFITKMLAPSPKFNTIPVPPAYYAITHTDMLADYQAIEGWTPIEKYPPEMKKNAPENEFGRIGNIRFLFVQNAKIWADSGGTAVTNNLVYTTANTACDVYCTLVFGKDAYGHIPLRGEALRNIRKSAKEIGGALEMYGTSGWKAVTTWKILNQSFMLRFEHGCSALSE